MYGESSVKVEVPFPALSQHHHTGPECADMVACSSGRNEDTGFSKLWKQSILKEAARRAGYKEKR